MSRVGRASFAALWRARPRPVPAASLAVGEVLGYRAPSGRIHLMRVTALLDMGGCIQPAIRFLDYAQEQLPPLDVLAFIPDRKRRPEWKKTELRIVDDEIPTREQLGLTLVGTIEAPGSETVPDPKAACEWAEVVAYLNSRNQLDQS